MTSPALKFNGALVSTFIGTRQIIALPSLYFPLHLLIVNFSPSGLVIDNKYDVTFDFMCDSGAYQENLALHFCKTVVTGSTYSGFNWEVYLIPSAIEWATLSFPPT